MNEEKKITIIGWMGSVLSLAMYGSYIDQIFKNLSGHPGSVILPIVTVFNCTAWTFYAWLPQKKAWPIIACNVPGICFGIVSAVTAVMGSR